MPANTPRGYTYATYDDSNDLALISQRLAEQVDADVQNVETTLSTQIAQGRHFGFLKQSTNQSVPNSTNTAMTLPNPGASNLNGLTYVTNGLRVAVAGLYVIEASVVFAATASAVYRVDVQINGTAAFYFEAPAPGTAYARAHASRTLSLAASDVVTLNLVQNTGAAITTSSAGATYLNVVAA